MTKAPSRKKTQALAAQQDALQSAAYRAAQFDVSSLSDYACEAFIATLPEPFDGQSETSYGAFVVAAADAFRSAFERKHRPLADSDRCTTLDALLATERRFASHWWTVLNEMRLHGQLPDWVKAVEDRVGSHVEMDAYHEAVSRTDLSVGRRPDVEYCIWDKKRNVLADGIESFVEASEFADELRARHPSAEVVRCLKMKVISAIDEMDDRRGRAIAASASVARDRNAVSTAPESEHA